MLNKTGWDDFEKQSVKIAMATDVHTTTLPPELKDRIMSEFWGIAHKDAGSSKDKRLTELYVEYYSMQVRLMLYNGGQNAPAWTHHDVVDVMTRIRDSQSRQVILAHLQSRLSADGTTACGDMVNGLIDLGARLCLMTSFGKAPFAAERQIGLEWTKDTAKHALHQHYTQQTVMDVESTFKLPKIFTARNIHHIGGLQIEWTPYISEHLRLLNHDECVAIFPHIGFLNMHRKRSASPSHHILLPPLTTQQ
jgi:hypothetical protein